MEMLQIGLNSIECETEAELCVVCGKLQQEFPSARRFGFGCYAHKRKYPTMPPGLSE